MRYSRIFLLFLMNTMSMYSQTQLQNFKKYWWYHHRLVNDFMAVGDCQGCSLAMGQRNARNTGQARWGDNTMNLGNYIAVLATEYQLLKQNNQPTDSTIRELYYALKAFNRLDYNAESFLRCNTCPLNPVSGDLNGFFMRDDVYDGFLEDHPGLSNGLTSSYSVTNEFSDYQQNLIGADSRNIMSQDQIWPIYMGCALISKFVDPGATYQGLSLNPSTSNIYIRQEAIDIADRIIYPIKHNAWIIKNPESETNLTNEYGGHVLQYAYGASEAFCYIQNPYVTTSTDFFPIHTCVAYLDGMAIANATIWNAFGRADSEINDNNEGYKIQTLAALGNSWWNWVVPVPDPISVTVTLYNPDNFLHPWTIVQQILDQTSLVPENRTEVELAYLAEGRNYHHLPLLRQVLHGGGNPLLTTYNYTSLLNDAPCQGPWCYSYPGNSAPFEWSTSNRLHKPDERGGDGGDNSNYGEFNGLDYMLYYNLYALTQGTNGPAGIDYTNYKDRTITYSFPHSTTSGIVGSFSNPTTIEGFSSITASNIVNSNAHVDYRAGREIHLTSGFHAIAGSEFHAYVDPFECDAGEYRMLTTANDTSNEEAMENAVAYVGQTTYVKYSPSEQNNVAESKEVPAEPSTIEVSNLQPETIEAANVSKSEKEMRIRIQPNPNSGSFEVIISGNERINAKLTMVTIWGTEILQQQITGSSTPIDISGQPKGIYYVKIESEQGIKMEKIIYQ